MASWCCPPRFHSSHCCLRRVRLADTCSLLMAWCAFQGMEPDCTDDETLKAKATSAKLSTLSNQFILRRTNTLLAKHLPTKLLTVVCCKPTPLQVQLYNHFLKSKSVKQAMRESGDQSDGKMGGAVLGIIQSLSKLCNHPRSVNAPTLQRSGPSAGSSPDPAMPTCVLCHVSCAVICSPVCARRC